MSLNVANCPRCGRIYAKTMKNLCPDCLREEEELYEKVYRFLRDNPKSTVQQVSKATDVPEERILNFLRQDRIMSSEWSQLTYPCETCGADISGGRFCESCNQKIQESLQSAAGSIKHNKSEARSGGYHIGTRRRQK